MEKINNYKVFDYFKLHLEYVDTSSLKGLFNLEIASKAKEREFNAKIKNLRLERLKIFL